MKRVHIDFLIFVNEHFFDTVSGYLTFEEFPQIGDLICFFNKRDKSCFVLGGFSHCLKVVGRIIGSSGSPVSVSLELETVVVKTEEAANVLSQIYQDIFNIDEEERRNRDRYLNP